MVPQICNIVLSKCIYYYCFHCQVGYGNHHPIIIHITCTRLLQSMCREERLLIEKSLLSCRENQGNPLVLDLALQVCGKSFSFYGKQWSRCMQWKCWLVLCYKQVVAYYILEVWLLVLGCSSHFLGSGMSIPFRLIKAAVERERLTTQGLNVLIKYSFFHDVILIIVLLQPVQMGGVLLWRFLSCRLLRVF